MKLDSFGEIFTFEGQMLSTVQHNKRYTIVAVAWASCP